MFATLYVPTLIDLTESITEMLATTILLIIQNGVNLLELKLNYECLPSIAFSRIVEIVNMDEYDTV